MSDGELVELWAERAAIIEEGCSSDVFWKWQPAQWRRHEAERLSYWDIKKLFGIERMPKQCWRARRDAGATTDGKVSGPQGSAASMPGA